MFGFRHLDHVSCHGAGIPEVARRGGRGAGELLLAMSEPVAMLPSLEGIPLVPTPHAEKRVASKEGKQSSKRAKQALLEQLVPPEIA